MEFTVLSHAGLLVESNLGKRLVCDPWLLGSSYWRSWWNYPPVKSGLLESLNPDIIYITHIHWDHFHGPTLEKFSKDVRILVPKGNYDRNKKDLNSLGFHNIYEMKHGETYEIDETFRITSYQFGVFLDSAPLIECDGTTLLNLNDSKHMGGTLNQIVKKHSPIDFVFRSHSSANSRISYEYIDEKEGQLADDIDKYTKDFTDTVLATGAKYAIPFASNHCHLHKDSWKYNHLVQTPALVDEYFKEHDIKNVELKVMLSGDKWNAKTGFEIAENDWFSNREYRLQEYLDSSQERLNKFYEEEDRTKISPILVQRYYKSLSSQIPFFLKKKLADVTYTYILYTHDVPTFIYNINIATGTVEKVDKDIILDFDNFPIQIHTTAFIFVRCIGFKIFSHMSIGKRVFYRMKKKDASKMQLLNTIYNLEEYDMLPISFIFSKRSLETWMLRWRELILYVLLVKDKLLTGKMDFSKYLKPYVKRT